MVTLFVSLHVRATTFPTSSKRPKLCRGRRGVLPNSSPSNNPFNNTASLEKKMISSLRLEVSFERGNEANDLISCLQRLPCTAKTLRKTSIAISAPRIPKPDVLAKLIADIKEERRIALRILDPNSGWEKQMQKILANVNAWESSSSDFVGCRTLCYSCRCVLELRKRADDNEIEELLEKCRGASPDNPLTESEALKLCPLFCGAGTNQPHLTCKCEIAKEFDEHHPIQKKQTEQ